MDGAVPRVERRDSGERLHLYDFCAKTGTTLHPVMLDRALAAMHRALVLACALTVLALLWEAAAEGRRGAAHRNSASCIQWLAL